MNNTVAYCNVRNGAIALLKKQLKFSQVEHFQYEGT